MTSDHSPLNLRAVVRERVMTMATQACSDATCLIYPVLPACVDSAIDRRWPSPVTSFLPLLAFRDVQECIRQGVCHDLPGNPSS